MLHNLHSNISTRRPVGRTQDDDGVVEKGDHGLRDDTSNLSREHQ